MSLVTVARVEDNVAELETRQEMFNVHGVLVDFNFFAFNLICEPS